MIGILEKAKDVVASSVHLLNQPLVKEGVKNLAGSVTFCFGVIEMHDLYCIARGRKISTEALSNSSWVSIAHKIVILCAKVSLILSAGVSRPGTFIISSVVGSVFSTAQLDKVFGANTLFIKNPWHPRHVFSIASVILALPSVMQSVAKGIDKIRHFKKTPTNEQNGWLTDSKIRMMTTFNTITSRPALHIGNQISRIVLR